MRALILEEMDEEKCDQGKFKGDFNFTGNSL